LEHLQLVESVNRVERMERVDDLHQPDWNGRALNMCAHRVSPWCHTSSESVSVMLRDAHSGERCVRAGEWTQYRLGAISGEALRNTVSSESARLVRSLRVLSL
jgi:hypothetical protein